MISPKIHELCVNMAWKQYWAKMPELYKGRMNITEKTIINGLLHSMLNTYKENLEIILRSKGVSLEAMEYFI